MLLTGLHSCSSLRACFTVACGRLRILCGVRVRECMLSTIQGFHFPHHLARVVCASHGRSHGPLLVLLHIAPACRSQHRLNSSGQPASNCAMICIRGKEASGSERSHWRASPRKEVSFKQCDCDPWTRPRAMAQRVQGAVVVRDM